MLQMQHKNILMLAGDGIGVEVCREATRILKWLSTHSDTVFNIESALFGGACYDAHHLPVLDETIEAAKKSDAVLLGAVGGPKYDQVKRDLRPEAALLRIRKELDLFANLRPAITFDELLDASSLKADIIQGLDLLIVRELTSGVYFGTPRGMQKLEDGSERCVDTQSYTKDEITRVAQIAFDLAGLRYKKVHSAEKSNVMETGLFWRQNVQALYDQKIDKSIELHHILADNCAMQIVRNPKQFDVILTDNLFGDLLSDAAAMCTGSLGMLPSASLGAKRSDGSCPALYEPVHGTAPDIAGKNMANPIAMILSVAMMLRYSFEMKSEADLIEKSIRAVLHDGLRTPDIACKNAISTSDMGTAIIAKMNEFSELN
ncbi:MAG: 3-isopropylmalate dehydrogenase [Pseudomonadota bacterium]